MFGLTGGVASGKGVVAGRFRELGVEVIDADELAREVVLPGTEGFAAVVAGFGASVVGTDGSLDRAALARIVFADPSRLRELNAIVHPMVQVALEQRLRRLEREGQSLVCYEVPLLFENGLEEGLRPVVLVAAPPEQQITRAMARSGWTRSEAEARIAAQMPLAEKRRRADLVIDNDESIDVARARATEVLEQVRHWQPNVAS